MQKVNVGNKPEVRSSSPREGRRLSPLSPSSRGRKPRVCLREISCTPLYSPPLPPLPAPGRQAGEIRRASAPPRRPALLRRSPPTPTPLCSAVLTPAGRGARAGCCAGLRGARSSCRCGYVGSAHRILPAGAEQNSMGGAAAAAGPTPGGVRRLRLGLVGASKDLVGAGRESVRDPPARRGVPGVGRGLALPPPPAGTLLKNEWGGRGHGGNFPTGFHWLEGRGSSNVPPSSIPCFSQ